MRRAETIYELIERLGGWGVFGFCVAFMEALYTKTSKHTEIKKTSKWRLFCT
jgi:hypothetical protein